MIGRTKLLMDFYAWFERFDLELALMYALVLLKLLSCTEVDHKGRNMSI